MISEKWREVVTTVEQLPAEIQDHLADVLEEALDEALWQQQFDDPRSGPAFDRLIEKAKNGPWLPSPANENIESYTPG